MPPQMMLLEGLDWIGSRDEWTAKRAWPDFLSAEVIEWHIEGKGEPTAAQKLTLRNLIAQAETIGTTLKEALFRYIKIARKKNPDWFEDCPAIRSAGQLPKLLELSSMTVLRQESDGEALIGLAFSCEWDPEHGFGGALYRGHLVDAGPFECSLAPSGEGLYPEAMVPEQKAVWQSLFGDVVADQKSRQEAMVAKYMEEQQRSLLAATDNTRHGPALRELSRLMADHPGHGLTFALDVPQPAPHVSGASAEALQKIAGGMDGGPMSEAFGMLKNMVSLSTAPPIPVAEIRVQLPSDSAMWNYTGQIQTERLEGGRWPGILQALAAKWPDAKPRFESITVFQYDSKYNKKPARKSPLQPAAVAAISELWGVEATAVTASSPLDDLRGGQSGVVRWNKRSDSERTLGGPYKKVDLKGAVLEGANLSGLDFQKACFDEARITQGSFKTANLNQSSFRKAVLSGVDTVSAKLKKCDFTEADLRGMTFTITDCSGANFDRADLRGVSFTTCKLQGADLSTANLEGTTFFLTEIDDQTKFPADFAWPGKMQLDWMGKGKDPRG